MITKKLFASAMFCILLWNAAAANATWAASVQTPGVTHYAAAAASGTGDCFSWGNACTLQTALSKVHSGDEIWVKEGVHYPTAVPSTDKAASFVLVDGVAILGGFDGYETNKNQRNFRENPTILSGDIDQNDLNLDGNSISEVYTDIRGANSYHIVTAQGVSSLAVLDGFYITGGLAYGSAPDCFGAAIYTNDSAANFANLIICGNRSSGIGGAIYNKLGGPMLINVWVSGNRSNSAGGGMGNENSTPIVINGVIVNNEASSAGGAMTNLYSPVKLVNVTISGNVSTTAGGINNYYSDAVLTNVIIWDDDVADGKEIFNQYSNPVITRSDIEGCGGTSDWNPECGPINMGNIDKDPFFVDPEGGDWSPAINSPVIDAGDNTPLPASITTDIAGRSRFVDVLTVPDSGFGLSAPIVDMGAYEVQYHPTFLPMILKFGTVPLD